MMPGALASLDHFRRPVFDPSGVVVARREVTLGATYTQGQEIRDHGLTERQLAQFWDLGLIDTLAPTARASQPSPQTTKRK